MIRLILLAALIAAPSFANDLDTPLTKLTPITYVGSMYSGAPPAMEWRQVQSASNPVEIAAQNAVKVSFPTNDGSGSQYNGSGVYLGDRFVATAYHVPRGTPGRGVALFRDGTQIGCTLTLADKDWDQALLTLDSEHPTLTGADLANANPKPGDRIYSVGFGQGYRIFGGEFTGFAGNGKSNYFDWFGHRSPAVSGDSGGPMFTEQGQLIGCLWGSGGGNTSGTSNGRFREFLKAMLPRITAWREARGCPPGRVCPIPPGNAYPSPSTPGFVPTVPAPPGGNTTQPPPLSSPPATCTPGGCSGDCCDCGDLGKQIADALAKLEPKPGPQGEMGPDGPPGPVGPKGDSGTVTDEHIALIVANVAAAIEKNPSMRGPQGERGEQGPAGQDAEPDLDALTDAELDALADAVIARLPKRRVVTVDGNSKKILDDESYAAGEPIVLDIQKLIAAAKAR